MQFGVIKETYLSQGEISKIAITGSGQNYIRYPLTGGGSILLLEKKDTVQKFLNLNFLASRKVLAIAVDENERN